MIEGLNFTSDWTTSHAANWERWLGHLVGTHCLGLEVGVFEARSSVWFLEHVCTHPESDLFAIDPWAVKSESNRAAIDRSEHGNRYSFITARSEDRLAEWRAKYSGSFDFAYLDGGKEAARVLEQSVLVWPLLKPGGILIWDDYAWQWTEGCPCRKPTLPPGPAIDAFLSIYAAEMEIIAKGWQVAVRKIDTTEHK